MPLRKPGLSWSHLAQNQLFCGVSSASMGVFRFCFGMVLLFHSQEYIYGTQTEEMWSGVFFTWTGFDWVRPLAPGGMQIVFRVMATCAIFVMLGLFSRVASLGSLLCCSYVFLLERVSSVNHDYFLCQLCLLMCFAPADVSWSLKSLIFPSQRQKQIPVWSIWMLRLQIGVPYFFGGVAKLTEAEWMSNKVTTALLQQVQSVDLIGPDGWNIIELLAWTMTWGGVLFDLLAVPLLIWPKTRSLFLVIGFCFHLVNAFLFRIELFPWLMMSGTLLYLEPDWPQRLWTFLSGGRIREHKRDRLAIDLKSQRRIRCLLAGWFLIQCLLPLRYIFYSGNPCWTLDCNYFSWRMMLHSKISDCVFFSTDSVTLATEKIPLEHYLSAPQYLFMRHDPQLIRQFACYVSARLNSVHDTHIIVRVIAKSAMNGNDPQWMIYPDIDLGIEPPSYWKSRWVVPYGDLCDYEIPDDLKPFFHQDKQPSCIEGN